MSYPLPTGMDPQDEKQLVHQLALTWVQANLPPGQTHYADFVRAIAGLHQATGRADRTTTIFRAVLVQGKQLQNSSDWMIQELRFEALAQFVDTRAEVLKLELEHTSTVDDDSLDLYIERSNRFTNHGYTNIIHTSDE